MDSQSQEFREIARQLLQQSRLSAPQAGQRLSQSLSPEYWCALSPALSVGEDRSGDLVEHRALDSGAIANLVTEVRTRGYFQVPSLISPDLVASMRTAVEALRAAGWPAVFAFVYDQFWTVVRGPVVSTLLGTILGGDYVQVPAVWAHYVVNESSGWSPHVDNSWGLNKVSLWLPLSDATLANGCMYVIPRDAATAHLADSFHQRASFSLAEVSALLHRAVPLPATAGSVLGWGPRVIHWGGRSRDALHPRVSLAIEFVGKDTPPESAIAPSPAVGALPTLEHRVLLIADALRHYRHHEPRWERFAPWADAVFERAKLH